MVEEAKRITYVAAGNDSPEIVDHNLRLRTAIHPTSKTILYDWGYSSASLAKFRRTCPDIEVVPWPAANPSNYMREKVACMEEAYGRADEGRVVFHDTDTIFVDRVDEVFDRNDWDIAGTWRPEYTYGRERFGVGQWLNSGVVFFNDADPERTRAFLREWLRRCDRWQDQSWWADQVELIRLFSEADPDLSLGPDRLGELLIEGKRVRCRTLPYQVYNFLPEMYDPYPDYVEGQAKIIHLKSPWRKLKFRWLPGVLRSQWVSWIASGYRGGRLLRSLNRLFNRFVMVTVRSQSRGS